MWGNSVYKAGAHQQSSLRPDGLHISATSSGTGLSPHSYPARLARPPPAGVLSADLARPISVRELAQSRLPVVPPPAAPPAPRPSATTAGFAGFEIPTSRVVYAATSGVSTSQLLSLRADTSDLTSLAHRDIDHLSRRDLYNYASHLQDASKQYSGYLLEAYTKRDQYRSEVAHLKEELHNRYMQIDVLRREQERTSDALLSVREENAQLREKLAEAEGHVRNIQAKMSVLSGADPSVAVHFYQSQLALKDAQLRELQQGCERPAAASSQRRGSSTTAADRGRLSTNISSEGAAAPRASPSQDLPNAGEVQDGADAASAPLHITLEELQCLNTSLSRRLEEEQISHKAALVAHAEASATAAADRAQLLDTIAQLRQQCTEMQATEDELVAALTQRAPVSKKDYEALQASYDDLTAALAKAEAHAGALQEKAQQHHQSAQSAQEELRHSLSIGLEERQALQARYEQMESLVNHLQRELELAERANQLRQEQLDAALSGNQQLAEHLRVAQEQVLSATSELQDLRKTRGDLESQLRELRQQKEGQEQGAHRPRHHEGDEDTEVSLHHTPASSADREAAAVTRPTLESEIATLRSERDALVVGRDDIMGDVQRLREERLALLQSPSPQAQTEVQNHLSAVKETVDTHADGEGSQPHDHLAALEAAHNCIEQMKQTIAALTSEHDRIETELKAQVTKLEGKLASQSSVLDQAEASAAAQQQHLEEVMVALRDELLVTQAQEKRLRVSEEALRERCGVQQRAAEQLQAHLMELEGAARHAASSLATPQSAQPRTDDSESNVMNEALESLANQLGDAQRQIEQLAAEHARTVEELARATRAVAELEARAADAESKREASHTRAEGASTELTAHIAALTMENAQLKEKLSASRAAVTTFASKQMDGESAAASLEELCAAEARRREAAEAEVSALRTALGDANAAAAKNAELLAGLDTARNAVASERAECAALRQAQERTAAELTEVLQRSEEVQATLERTLTRLAEQEALVEQLSTESVRLQDELAAAQESVLLLRSERDAFGEEAAQLHGKLAAAEDRASDVSAAQQRLQVRLEEAEAAARSREAELGTALAALDRAASEVCDAEQKLQVYTEAKEQLAAEHARTVEELARATRAVAELEARAADAESKREASHTRAEGASTELTAHIAALTMENAQLKEKLSASRAAVTTFASKQMDGESAAASLEELCAAEARRREAAEAEVSALRTALGDANAAAAKNAELLAGLDTARNAVASERAECAALRQAQERTAAELTEVLQRSEEVQATLERTLTRLAEQEALVERLNREALEFNAQRPALEREVVELQGALAVAITDKADVVAQLVATQKELDRAAEVHDEHYREEERLHEALSTTTSAFAVQTAQVRLGMAHVVDMSRAFCGVAEAVAQRAACSMPMSQAVNREVAAHSSTAVRLAAPTGDALISVKCLREILLPWTQALEWVAAMEKRLDALDAGAISGRTSIAGGHGERRRRRRGRAAPAEEEDEVVVEAGSSALALGESFLCRAVPTSDAEAAFARWMDVQSAAANIIAELRSALAEKEAEVSRLRSAMDALATELMDEQDRAGNLSAAIDDAAEKIASAQAEFEEQLRQRTAATTAEVVEARRAEARATAAQLRAEERLTAVEDDLKEQQALLRNLQDENRRLTREANRLLHSSRLTEPGSRDRSKVSDSATPQSLSPATPAAEDAAKRFATAASAVEAVEEALILQVSSLQADLMLSRRHARELEGREATVRQACLALEQQVSELRVEAAGAGQLREDFAALRADYADLEQRYNQLERMTTAAGGGTMQELKQLRQQLKVREAELRESKARLRGLVLSKATPELEATRRQEALRESLSGITTQLAATQAQYGGCTGGSGSARSRRPSLAAALSNSDPLNRSAPSPSPQDVLTSRIEHLQLLVRDREMALDKVQAAQLESRAAVDTLEDQLAVKTAALERAEGLVAEYADTINTITMTVVAGRGSRGARPTTARPVRNVEGSPHAGALSPSVPPLTPLTPRTRAALSEQLHAVAAAASPAPRMPSLDEVADDNNGLDLGKGADSPRSSSATSTPSVTRRHTGACSNREGAEGSTTRLPSSSTSTKRSASSSPSNGSGRKSLAGATMLATTRKRARFSSTA
ncbi:hypothetical protein GH5_04661 [Leishmania sp. Ghana 2012 LV757]|uniref:hypothetical protein n=1 Tax=Leishmania sp. Ghana 2012 LV757 TaxID=2803181 RepID=UPI001B635FD8|nr:hypothetical protein GH5_04661 [Leishmania sp. Ghana 2012 LV757]